MTRIDQKEYWFLKGLDDKWKWIARDRDDLLYIFNAKPSKGKIYAVWSIKDRDDHDYWEIENKNLFQFVQWKDSEPYNISELIEEYLDDEYGYLNMRPTREFEELIEKESEETRVKSKQEAIKESGVPKSDWNELIRRYNWHSEQENCVVIEKPTIPQFVSEFLRGKEEYMLYELLDNDFIYDDYDELARWLYNNDEDTNREREFSLVLAHRYGYEVEEEEQKFYAKIKGHENISSDDKYWNYCITDESLDIGDNKVHADVLDEYVLNATKDEWENLGINDDNADFVSGEEMEE